MVPGPWSLGPAPWARALVQWSRALALGPMVPGPLAFVVKFLRPSLCCHIVTTHPCVATSSRPILLLPYHSRHIPVLPYRHDPRDPGPTSTPYFHTAVRRAQDIRHAPATRNAPNTRHAPNVRHAPKTRHAPNTTRASITRHAPVTRHAPSVRHAPDVRHAPGVRHAPLLVSSY